MLCLEWRLCGGHKKHLVETKTLLDVPSYVQVTEVHGVETPPHDANTRLRRGYDHHPALHIFDWSTLRDQQGRGHEFYR